VHARFYNPQVGRFLSTDAANSAVPGKPQSWNQYGYALGNPVNLVDPNGESPVLLLLVAAGVAGGLIFGAEPANTPTSDHDPNVVRGSDGMKAVAASSTVITIVKAAMEIVGLGDERPQDVTIDSQRYPESAAHAREAQESGQPDTLTIDRKGADARRRDALRGTSSTPGKDRDEYPPAMFKEGGAGASVRPVAPSDNRGAGACIGAQCKELPDGTRVRLRAERKPPPT
jgi:hypothetical protein